MLKNFWGKNNFIVSACPSYSFFNKRSQIYDSSLDYLQTLEQNKNKRHTNFNTNNTKYEPECITSNYELDLNSLLNWNKHHLLGRIVIYMYNDVNQHMKQHVNQDTNKNDKTNSEYFENLQNIKLEIDEALFEYDLVKLIGIKNKFFNSNKNTS